MWRSGDYIWVAPVWDNVSHVSHNNVDTEQGHHHSDISDTCINQSQRSTGSRDCDLTNQRWVSCNRWYWSSSWYCSDNYDWYSTLLMSKYSAQINYSLSISVNCHNPSQSPSPSPKSKVQVDRSGLIETIESWWKVCTLRPWDISKIISKYKNTLILGSNRFDSHCI